MDKNLLQKAKAPMIALIQTKNIMNDNNLKTKTKRAAALILMLALLVSAKAWAQSFGGGSGTQTDPYIILSIDHMNQLAEYTGSTQGLHFRLDADLDYKDENGVNGLGLGFKTIAHFSGTFDGNGHYISNAWVSGSGRDNHGLFGTLDLYGTIKNLNLVNLEIIGLVNVGGIVGAIEGGYVINCKLYNCFIMSTNYVGGIAGYINPQLIFSVKDCVVDEYSTVSGIGITNNSSIGGIVGYMIIDHYAIENNYFLGELKLDDVNHFPQGIIVGNIPGYDRNINYYNPELNSELPSSAVEGATPVYGIYDWQKVTEVVSGEVLSIPVTPNSTNSDTIGYAMPDTTIVLRQNPAEGYACSDFTAQGATLTHVSNDIYSFVMPNNSVTISATLCEPIAITNSPYFEDFESPAGTLWTRAGPIADCWKGYARYSGHKAPHNSIGNYYAPNYVHSGVQSLSFYNMGENYALFPEFSNPIYDLQVSFWMKTDGDSSTGSGQLQLGYITVEDDGTCNTFTEIATYSNNTDSMVQCSTTLENVSAEAHRLAFKWSATNYICFIDDVTVSLNLALKPTDLTCTEVTNTSATLTWTSNAESWQIMLNDDETNLIMADTNPFTLTGLVPETFYTAKVRSYWDSDNQSEWSDPVSFSTNGICPEGMVCIGNGMQTNYNLPTSNYYKYGLTQQIYTADEIGQAGCITSIEFFKASAYTMTRNLDIYLVCTDKDEFENTSDWIPVTANDLVFSGAVTFADQDWTTITLDEPFNYYGTSNVAVVVDDNTGGFSYSLPFHVFSTEKEQTILYCDSNNNYDPTASPGNAISTTNEKNRIRLGMEELPGCERPTLLAVDTLGATSATLSWTENGEATAWQIMLNDDHTNLIEADSNPFTLDSLIPETIYTAKVRAHCPDGNGISLWSSPISFNPTRAFTIGAGTATNNDLPTNNFYKYSYTQQIYTTEELGEAGLIERIDFFKNSTAACNRNLDIYLVSTDKSSFDGGNDWIVTTEEDLVFSGTVNFVDKAWTIITFDKPFIYNGLHNVAIIVDDHTGSYVSRTPFLVFDAPNQALSTYHDKGEKAVLGQKNQIRVLKSAMGDCINPTMLTASELNYYDATLTWEENGTSTEWVVDYWYLNSSNEEVHNQLTVADSTHCHIENLSDNIEYHAKVRPACDENKWSNTAVFTTLEACSVPVITLGTVTATTAELTWTGLSEGYTVMYRESIVRVAGEWQTLSVDEAAVTLTNLVPEADYEVKVIPSCDETKESAILTFTTANPCEVPTNLAVGNVTPTTAEISWDGVSLTGYEVEYYTATLIDTLLSEGFESGALPQGWTIEGDNQDPTKTWRVGAGDDQASTGTHSGDYNALITHNNRDEVTYLVMPAIDLGDYDNAQLSFWYVNRNWASDIDEIGVFYRIGTEGEWNELWSTADAHATWTNQTLALTGLADNYQIGFKMIDHWGRGIGLDDIVVFHELAPAGEPMTLTVVEGTTTTLTGLADNTTYEARVKSNCDAAEYCSPVVFTTAEMETFTKEIVGYGESNGGYYLIASPVVEPVMPSEENGFLTNAFDLYRFNQNGVNALEWENWKAEENYHYPIENGRGYLYASHDSTTLTFSGTPYSGNGQVTLTKTDGVTFEGWNLVGNPFPTMAFIADGRPFYTVNGDGSQIIGVVGHSVEVMEAIFVIAEEDGETMTFTTEMPALGASLSLNVMAVEPSDTPTHRAPTVIDRAIIRFGEGRQLPKFQLNGNSTKVYIPQGGMDYAVVCSEGKGELPLNFKAAKNGTYTLSVNMENMEFDYLHLIDNLTGADIDLLAVEPSVPEPVEGPNATGTGPSTSSGTSYTFTAKTTDYESRFKLVFSADEDVCEPNEAFAYINNGNIVITTDMGDATLQIVDVMGRVVASYSGHTRCVSTSGMTAGVYVLRLIDGENVRTQKIVVDF